MHRFSRRDFLLGSAVGVASFLVVPEKLANALSLFPQAEKLGRVTVGMAEVKNKPDTDSKTIAKVYADQVVEWLYEVVGRRPFRTIQRWVETPIGYIWIPYLQPVKNLVNTPIAALPETSLGPGMWAEVTTPYVDILLDNPPARSPWLAESQNPRLYYSQVFWIDKIKTDTEGRTWYRVNERYGYGDLFWARADSFRPLNAEEVAPIHPEVENKRIVVHIGHQTMSCYEGKQEVHFAFVSTGITADMYGTPTPQWETPLGVRPIWRKMISVHMSGGSTGGGYDLPGVSWTSLFEGNGVAIHSTFWHNNFGEQMSHGCVNAAPDDAKWVFRWTNPVVTYDPGDLTVGMPGGTLVEVIQG
jgi:hypothetical protein